MAIQISGTTVIDNSRNLDNIAQVNVSGISTFGGNVFLGDNDKAVFGASSDLQIYHDGSNSTIENSTGAFYIQNNADDSDIIIRSDNSSGGVTDYVVCDGSTGEVLLSYYGSQKLNTTTSGINVTGTVTCDGVTSEGDTTITNATGKLIIKDSNSTGSSAQQSISGHGSDDGEDWYVGQTSSSNAHLELVNRQTGDIRFGTSDNYRVYIDSNGHLNPYLDSNYDLGADAIRWRNVYADTLYGDGSNLTGIAAGGSGTFDTGISTSIIVPVTGGIGANDDQNRDIFAGPGIAYSFPSTASTQYVIESIHVVNKSGGNLYVSGRHDISGGANVPIANRVVVPYAGAVELLEQPHVANLSDVIRLQALTGTGTSATGANNGLDAFITYSTKTATSDYIGVAQTITSTDQEFFEVASNPCVLQSLNLVNYSNNVDVDVSVSVFSGGTTGGIATTGIRRGYLTYNMTVPRNSTIEVLEKPKRLESNQALLITASSNNTIGVVLGGKYITS